MSTKLLLVINAIVLVAFGLFLLVAPGAALAQFRMDARATELFLARALGATLTSMGLVLFFARDADESAQKFLGMAALAGAVLALLVALIGVAGGVVRSNGWIAILVALLFALGYVFVVFVQPRMQPPQE